jgi:hypothetical protein
VRFCCQIIDMFLPSSWEPSPTLGEVDAMEARDWLLVSFAAVAFAAALLLLAFFPYQAAPESAALHRGVYAVDQSAANAR